MKALAALLATSVLACLTSAAQAAPQDEAWRTTAGFETWAYGTHTAVREDAVLNPGNRIAQVASGQALLDGRFNLRAEQGPWQLVANPRLLAQQSRVQQSGLDDSSPHSATARLSQGFVRYQAGDVSVTAGRELFVWGPANFRSPSSPFYFDAGRTNPLAATPGVDLVRGTLGVDSFRLTGAWVASTSQIVPALDQGQTALLKLDQQGASHLLSLVVSHQRGASPDAGPFVGGFAQFTPDDAWLLYGEFGSARQPLALTPNSPGVPGPFYSVAQPGPRASTALLGANYTLENGQALVVEYLRNQGGYSADQARAYFQQAANAGVLAQRQPALGYGAIGQALGQAPRLLGRDYLWLNWQSNPQSSGSLWRLGWTQNLNDHSGQAMAYAEKNFVPRLSGFVALTANRGGVRTEYGALWRASLTAGLKWYVF